MALSVVLKAVRGSEGLFKSCRGRTSEGEAMRLMSAFRNCSNKI